MELALRTVLKVEGVGTRIHFRMHRFGGSKFLLFATAGSLVLVVGAAGLNRAVSGRTPTAATEQVVLGAEGATTSGSYSYVIVDGGFRVYDIDGGYSTVKSVTFPDAAALVVPEGGRGRAWRTGCMRAISGARRTADGYVVAYDLRRDRSSGRREPPGRQLRADPDGRKMYAPCGEARGGLRPLVRPRREAGRRARANPDARGAAQHDRLARR